MMKRSQYEISKFRSGHSSRVIRQMNCSFKMQNYHRSPRGDRSALRYLILVLVGIGFMTGVPLLTAQNYLGAINGSVQDSSGAVVAGAEITVTQVGTQFVSKGVSGKSGVYNLPSLQPGTYSVNVTMTGFRPERRDNVVLTAGQTQQVDFALAVGAATESMVVSVNTVQVDATSANLSDTLSQKEVSDTPNLGRNPFVMATLAPGVTSGAYMQGKASSFTNPYSGVAVQIISEGTSGHNRLTLNGIPDDPAERFSGATYTGFVPSPEAVQEVKVQTAVFDAQYGHGNGTVTNTVVKSGTNDLHGAAYYIFHNTYLNANTYENVPNQNSTNPSSRTPRTNDQLSQTGFVLDGPVYLPKVYNGRNKTFFMVAYERYNSHTSMHYSTHVPTAAERDGDFSDLCTAFVAGICQAGAGVQLYDPTTLDASNNRTPFLNNNLKAKANAAGVALLGYFPLPNASQGNTNYISNQTSYRVTYPSLIVRLDQALGANNKLNATFFRSGLSAQQPLQGFPKGIGPTGFGYTVYRRNLGGSIDDTHIFSPTLVLNAHLGVLFHPFGLTYPGNSNFNLSSIGMDGANLAYQSFPGVTNTDGASANNLYAGLAAGAGGQISTNSTSAIAAILTKTISRHSLRFGFEGNLIRYNVQNPQSGFGTFLFNREFTQKNSINVAVGADANSGNPFAAMYLGYPSSGSYSNQIAYALQQIYVAPFIQDDWRVTPKLTVNLGLRWDYESPMTERFNRQNAAFCTTCANPLQASVAGLTLMGGLQFADGNHRFPYRRDLNNFQPRVGLAYQLSDRLVLRAGYGVIYFNTLETPFAQGYSASTSYAATSDKTHPSNNISSPFPTGVNQPSGSSLGLSTQLGQSITYIDPNHVQPKAVQYSVSTQAQLIGNTVLSIAYAGSRASLLEVNRNINILPQQYYDQGATGVSYLNASVANPMAGKIPNSTLNSTTLTRNLLLLPYPEFGSVTEYYSSAGSVPYNSLQVSVVKPFTHRFSLHGNLTWSKTMLHTSYLNPFDTKLASVQDPNSTIVANIVGTYQFTQLNGYPFLEKALLGGWQVNGVLRAQNGNLISNPAGVTVLQDPSLGSKATYVRYFNNCYLTTAGVRASTCNTGDNPAFQQRLSYTTQYNTTYMHIRQRIHPLLDVSVFKKFVIHEHTNFEIRGEFFNVMNTPNFGGPGTSLGSATFGMVTLTQANDPRIGQLTARINF